MPDTDTVTGSYRATIDADPYPFYAGLRGDGVRWDDEMGAWLVGSYEAVKEVLLKDDESYAMPDRIGERKLEHARWTGGPRVITLLEGDEHKRMHRWWMQQFSPTRIAEWRASVIRVIVDRAIDRFAARGAVELAAEL